MMSIIKSMMGKCSWFGGPNDHGVRPHEGLALVTPMMSIQPFWKPLFLQPYDPDAGLARQLNPEAMYCAMRWDYDVTTAHELRSAIVRVESGSGIVVFCRPVDWGPNVDTGRVIDLSPGAMKYLGVVTDNIVKIDVIL